MNTGKTLFAQLMDFLPWTTFTRIVDRYGGDHRVRTLSCAEQYRSMAFAQLTYRESLRDIETCLSVHASKLYHMGFRQPVRRSTLADANERRDWRIHAALAQRLITQARTLYVDEERGLDLTNTVYALDSTTIALCLSVFPWAHFRTTQGGGEDAHAARPAGQHSEFYPHLGWQAARRSCPRYALAGSRSHLRRGSWLRRLCPPLDETWVGGRTRGEGRGVHHKVLGRLCRRGSSSETGNRAGQAKGRTLCRACQARRSTRSERRLALWVRGRGAVAPRTLTVTDDWSGYASLGKRGYEHFAVAECGRPRGCRGLSADHPSRLRQSENVAHRHPSRCQPISNLQAYLNEFTFRFNRRFYPFNAFRSLLGIAGDVSAPTFDELYSGEWEHPTCCGVSVLTE